ncbi:hypothetical protein NP493_110g00024 [Ridgeia piscesae]|uniref:Uncharacterized protein n=1 Tax=Ridgeia piscesae TaxID=27915 RepID=A0AAD9P6K0_RIDPI|nr:hypothetical protein NP493_110g00024 [Ridgeia piscesae]
MNKEVTDWAAWQAALDRGDSVEELLGLGTDHNCHQNSQVSQPQQSSSSPTQNETTALTVPELAGRTLQFVLPVKPFHGHGQKMEPPVSSLSDRLLVTAPFIPVDSLLGPCMYVPPDKKQS